jgi:pilus assembly protein FimV
MLMRKCRWLSVALLAVCVGLPAHSWALGLGELQVDSSLNERFAGSIELLDATGFQTSEIMVTLASREDFERVGVERFFYLTNLDFEVELSGSTPQVKVSSSQPVAEPYLNFIVEVLWPRGRLLKEFTVLLDPPTFSAAPAPAVSAAEQAPVARPAPRVTAPAAAPEPAAPAAERGTRVALTPQSAPRRLPGAEDGVMTTRDDTLWKIAQSTLPSGRVTVNQQMLAIQRKNPQAFMRDNINLLKAGYVLDIPTESEALALTAEEAIADVAQQARDWRRGATAGEVADSSPGMDVRQQAVPDLAAQVDATRTSDAASGAGEQSQGEVRIVANTGELASGTATGDDPSVNQLIEEKDGLARQVDELTYQLDREKEIAANEVAVKDRQLEVKDAELAQLQEQMKQIRSILAEAQAEQNQNQSPSPSAPETPWWMSPMLLLGVIGVLVLVLAVALVALRRNRLEQEEYEAAIDYEPEPAAENLAAAATAAAVVQPLAAAEDDVLDSDVAEADMAAEDRFDAVDELAQDDAEAANADDANTAAKGQGETGDVIGEAEIYIAYGRYGQAANLLSGALAKEPDRWDVRLKMLEVCVESHDEEGFETHAQYLLDNCDDEEVLLACRELEAQFQDSHVDFSADTETVETEDTQEALVVDDDADADVLDLDLSESAEDAQLEDLQSDEVDEPLDFELEFDAESSEEAAPEPLTSELAEEESAADEAEAEGDDTQPTAATAALGGDLGLAFDPDRDVDDTAEAPQEQEPETVEALDDLEFDLSTGDADEAGDADLDDLLLEFEDQPMAESDDVSSAAEPLDAESAGEDGLVEEIPAAQGAGDAADDFEFDASGDGDINATKLDLAEAYVDMGDADGAQDILSEVLEEGTPEQQQKAREMLDRLAS